MNRIDEIAEEISMIMPRIARHVTMGITQVFQLTPPQVFTIMVLQERESCSFSDLSQMLKVSAPTVTGIIDRLEKAEYVLRVPSKEDRRVIHIELTAKGDKFGKQIRQHVKEKWAQMLSKVSKTDWAQL